MPYRVIALSTGIAEQVRASGKAPGYNHPASVAVATGHGPCRHCLRTFRAGAENRILFTYDPFAGIESVPLPGPVFIHEHPCTRYCETDGYPSDLMPYPVVLSAFAWGQTLVERRLTDAAENKEDAVYALLERPDVDYIDVRDRTAGCFDFRIERAGQNGSHAER